MVINQEYRKLLAEKNVRVVPIVNIDYEALRLT